MPIISRTFPARRIAVAGSFIVLSTFLLLAPREAEAQRKVNDSDLKPVDTASAPYRQFAHFLELAVASRRPHVGYVDSVYTRGTELGVDEGYEDMRWVAAYRILSVATAADSGVGVAIITRVARQTSNGHGWIARYGIRDDTALWRLTRGEQTGGRWKVLGDAVDGFGMFEIGRDVRWVTGSRAKALAAVDSIRRARGLKIVR